MCERLEQRNKFNSCLCVYIFTFDAAITHSTLNRVLIKCGGKSACLVLSFASLANHHKDYDGSLIHFIFHPLTLSPSHTHFSPLSARQIICQSRNNSSFWTLTGEGERERERLAQRLPGRQGWEDQKLTQQRVMKLSETRNKLGERERQTRAGNRVITHKTVCMLITKEDTDLQRRNNHA